MVQRIYSKMHPVSGTNSHHDVTDLENHGMVKNTKTWISWEQNIIFLQNKKILNLCFWWHILRSYQFVAEVNFKKGLWHRNFPDNFVIFLWVPFLWNTSGWLLLFYNSCWFYTLQSYIASNFQVVSRESH